MKYAALQAAKLLLLAVLAVLLWGILHADPQQADFSVLREQAEQAMDTTGMRQADAQLLRRLYGLNGGELAGWALWTSEDNMAVEELLLAECVSEAQAEQVREALEARSFLKRSLSGACGNGKSVERRGRTAWYSAA